MLSFHVFIVNNIAEVGYKHCCMFNCWNKYLYCIVFKRKLNADNTKPPSYFNSGSRLGQNYHARLRTHCSSLNEHLFTKNIVDSPLCVCGEVENTHHYLFDCTRYDDLRRELLNAVSHYCEPTVNTILFGNSSLTSNQNQNIFIAVQDNLIKSKRFQVN